MEKNNRKPLVALVALLVIGVIGGTFAYYTSTDTFENIFSTKPYQTEVVETFKSPSDWVPGTKTPKTVVVTNKGDVEVAVRVSYTEKWVDSAGTNLSLTDAKGTSAAVINFASTLGTNWTKATENGSDYYYYNTKLAKGESTTSFIDAVTFNPAVEITTDSNCVDDAAAGTKTCTTSTTGYGGGKYTLTIKVETVQFDQYKTAWGTAVAIS